MERKKKAYVVGCGITDMGVKYKLYCCCCCCCVHEEKSYVVLFLSLSLLKADDESNSKSSKHPVHDGDNIGSKCLQRDLQTLVLYTINCTLNSAHNK